MTPNRIDTFLAATAIALTVFMLNGCAAFRAATAAPTIPYTTERRVDELAWDWASGGTSTGKRGMGFTQSNKIVTVHNPFNQRVLVAVYCEGNKMYDDTPASMDELLLGPGQTKYLVVALNPEMMVGDACYVDHYVAIP